MTSGRVAAFFGQGKPMELREYDVPDPEPGAVVLRTTMANVCGSDVHQWRGEFDVAKFGRPYPQILGHEMTGRVHALGDGIGTDTAGQPLRVGDRVVFRYFYPCGHCRACMKGITRACPDARFYLRKSCDSAPHFVGAFGDYYYVYPGAAIYRVPDELPDAAVAGINCALSQVVGGLQLAGIRIGDNVVIQGAGGLGVYACAVAREMGAARIVVIDRVDERLELARQFGADAVVDLREYATQAARIERVKALTDDWGGDVVMELVGNPNVVDEGLRMVALEGTYLEVGNINVGWETKLDPSWILFGNRRIIGVAHYEAEHLKGALDLMLRTRHTYPYHKIVSHTFSLDQINEAFKQQEGGHITRGAIAPN